ncbi:tryptophan 2,3-dioxygenase family protein [Streptomyces sp. NPDC048301]|uniref:tryptophan 2,3-dioxygenase family protein n=1 Tax=unclassified Streptomyces TaxID=2593676 RepID=UPI00342489A7
MKDYSEQILTGEGENDYTRYMRTDALLSLQRLPEESVHRDELLFQIVHQSTELWLKLACTEVTEATARIEAGDLDTAARLLARAALGAQLVTQQLEMMRHLSPWDFQTIRTVLGHGSGADSPGWRSVRACNRLIGAAFLKLVADRGVDLAELYRSGVDTSEFRLAEAMIEWDERISIWRVQHFKMTTRIIGHQVVGTQGTPVDVLAKLISHKHFPELWQVRTELTETGPMGDRPVGGLS